MGFRSGWLRVSSSQRPGRARRFALPDDGKGFSVLSSAEQVLDLFDLTSLEKAKSSISLLKLFVMEDGDLGHSVFLNHSSVHSTAVQR